MRQAAVHSYIIISIIIYVHVYHVTAKIILQLGKLIQKFTAECEKSRCWDLGIQYFLGEHAPGPRDSPLNVCPSPQKRTLTYGYAPFSLWDGINGLIKKYAFGKNILLHLQHGFHPKSLLCIIQFGPTLSATGKNSTKFCHYFND